MTETRTIGKALLRREDYRFVTGQGRYLDDVVVPGMLFAAFVRSPVARGTILDIDTAAARALKKRAVKRGVWTDLTIRLLG